MLNQLFRRLQHRFIQRGHNDVRHPGHDHADRDLLKIVFAERSFQ